MAHQIDESKPKYLSQTRFMSGRRIIKTSVTEITDENVVDVLRKALAIHDLNRSEIDYLWKYYRGDQPIRNRVKDVRPEICNKITENRANEIVSFKVGYLCGEPIQYVSRNGGEEIVKQINTLNEYMFAEDKAAQDQELVEWQMICGTAFRLVLPDEPGEEDEAPFELYTLDPRDTFVVYSNEIGNKPLMAVKYSKDDNEIFHYSIYTENRYYLVDGDILVESKPHALDMIPIIEYPGNNARLGSFESSLLSTFLKGSSLAALPLRTKDVDIPYFVQNFLLALLAYMESAATHLTLTFISFCCMRIQSFKRIPSLNALNERCSMNDMPSICILLTFAPYSL